LAGLPPFILRGAIAADTGGWVAQPAASRPPVAADAWMNARLVSLISSAPSQFPEVHPHRRVRRAKVGDCRASEQRSNARAPHEPLRSRLRGIVSTVLEMCSDGTGEELTPITLIGVFPSVFVLGARPERQTQRPTSRNDGRGRQDSLPMLAASQETLGVLHVAVPAKAGFGNLARRHRSVRKVSG
jgi:hypothetical protein